MHQRSTVAIALAALIAIVAIGQPARAEPGGFALQLLLQGDEKGGGGAPGAPATAPPLAAWAGPAKSTSLPELLQTAIRQTPALESARIDIAIAEARVLEASGVDDWKLTAEATGRRATQTFLGATSRSTTASVGADIIRALPTGGTIDLHAETAFDETEGGFSNSRLWSDAVTATITHPLFRGRGSATARAALHRAKLGRDTAALTRNQVAINAVQTIIASYWDLALAERQLAIRRAGLDLIRERRRLTQAGISGGKVAPSELLAVDQAVATQEELILTAEVAIVQRSIAVRRNSGLPIAAGAIALASGADASAAPRTATLEGSLRRAYETAPELQLLAVQDKDAAIVVEVTENGMLPRLDAALTLGPSGRDNRPSQAIKNMAKFDEFQISGTLSFEYDLGNRTARGANRAARLERDKIKVTATDVRAQIAEAVATQVASLELAARRIELASTAITLAKKNIDVEQARFTLGKSTNFDVLQRQNELQQAELTKAQAEIDARKAEASLAALTGDLLEEYGISVDARKARR